MKNKNDSALSHLRTTNLSGFLYGSPYYPEHWDAATRASDPALFAAAHWNVVRLAEFAWDILEPREGVFDFTLFDETISRMGAVGIRSIMCTPTATPPRWLTRDYPEVLRMDADGRRLQHGSRQHADAFSPIFREFSRKITRALAEHYRDNPFVIGWQTDNEIHCHFSQDYSPATQVAWIAWLRTKFRGDIHALNLAWGTAFWANTYECFEDVVLPRPARPTWQNPAHVLDYQRFLSDGMASFQREQIDILRATNSHWFVTHNGCFSTIDYRSTFTRDLDFLSFDSYPFFCADHAERAANHAFALDHVRAFSGHFFLMEQQSGAGGQGDYFHDNPEPGEMNRMAWTSIARGADGLLFFRERSCRFGAEEYWEGVIGHDNVPRRRYHEAAVLGAELKRIAPLLLGTTVQIDIGVAGADFTANQGHEPLSHGLPSPKNMAESVHGVFYRAGYAVGVVHPADILTGLKVYIVPHLALFDPEWMPALEKFVAAGGTLIVGARTASKDQNNNVVSLTLPGVLRELVGATVEEYGRQNSPIQRPLALRFSRLETTTTTELWYEQLTPDPGTEVLATWVTRHLAGKPVITRRTLGKGNVIYVGTYFTRAITETLLAELAHLGLLPATSGPGGDIETIVRTGTGGRHLRFIINHADASREVALNQPGHDLITAAPVAKIITLPAYGVALIAESNPEN
jgi:beta-galactosidase